MACSCIYSDVKSDPSCYGLTVKLGDGRLLNKLIDPVCCNENGFLPLPFFFFFFFLPSPLPKVDWAPFFLEACARHCTSMEEAPSRVHSIAPPLLPAAPRACSKILIFFFSFSPPPLSHHVTNAPTHARLPRRPCKPIYHLHGHIIGVVCGRWA